MTYPWGKWYSIKCKYSLGNFWYVGTPSQNFCSAQLIWVLRVPCWHFHGHSSRWWLVHEHSQPGGWRHPAQTTNADGKRKRRDTERDYFKGKVKNKHGCDAYYGLKIFKINIRGFRKKFQHHHPDEEPVTENPWPSEFLPSRQMLKSELHENPHTTDSTGEQTTAYHPCDTRGCLPSRVPPVCLLVFFRSHPVELQLDTARYWYERHVHQTAPADSDGPTEE